MSNKQPVLFNAKTGDYIDFVENGQYQIIFVKDTYPNYIVCGNNRSFSYEYLSNVSATFLNM